LNACPYRAKSVLHRRPLGWSIEATTILTRGGVESLAFDEDGLLIGDREWAVVEENSSIAWQGSHPRLALVHPEFQEGHPTVRNGKGDHVQFETAAMCTRREVYVWNDTAKRNDVFTAIDAGDEVAAFLANTVGAKLRLVLLGREARRRDGSNRVHIVSPTSFNELAAELPLTAQAPQNIMRFRPNIVVTGWSEPLLPFIEEQFTKLEWNAGKTMAELRIGDRCIRCVVPNVDPTTGGEDARVLEVLSKHSAARYPGEPIYFGLYATAKGPCTLKRGAVLEASLTI
jgi:uncharacterized protein